MKRETAILEFAHGPWKVMVEDDGVVAYAYLLRDEEIVGDVWLYNQEETPVVPEWRQQPPPAPPFRNAEQYVGPGHASAHPISLTEIAVRWQGSDVDLKAEILLREHTFAILMPGARPGFSAWVIRDSPVARKLIPE
jgi:hypothetical protein